VKDSSGARGSPVRMISHEENWFYKEWWGDTGPVAERMVWGGEEWGRGRDGRERVEESARARGHVRQSEEIARFV